MIFWLLVIALSDAYKYTKKNITNDIITKKADDSVRIIRFYRYFLSGRVSIMEE